MAKISSAVAAMKKQRDDNEKAIEGDPQDKTGTNQPHPPHWYLQQLPNRTGSAAKRTYTVEVPQEITQPQRAESGMTQTQGSGTAPVHDSADRRQATAAELGSKGISADAIRAKMGADVSQAKPATEATAGAVNKTPKARNTIGRGPQTQRPDLGR